MRIHAHYRLRMSLQLRSSNHQGWNERKAPEMKQYQLFIII